MIGSPDILKELYRSMIDGTMLGLFIKSNATSSFIITRIKTIMDDPNDPDNKLITLPEKDIHGNDILVNPVPYKNIIGVRDYNILRGVEAATTK